MWCHGWTRVYPAWTKCQAGSCRQRPCLGKGLQPRNAWCTEGGRMTPPPGAGLGQHRGPGLQGPLSLRVGGQTRWAPLRAWAGRTRQKEPQKSLEEAWVVEKHGQGGERGPRSLPAHGHRWPASPRVFSTQITWRWSELGPGTGSILFTNHSLEKTRVLRLRTLSL